MGFQGYVIVVLVIALFTAGGFVTGMIYKEKAQRKLEPKQ